jgi:trans-2,3-dihydro-3-hydroxyanthranilate isomerase
VKSWKFVTLDVFTETRFGGNQLAVFPDARGLTDAQMQALAAELNLSETTFVLPPASPANTARVRIFNRKAEMPFAGHPNVGTGFVLAEHARDGMLRFEEIAGLVEVAILRDEAGAVTGAEIGAPQPLSTGPKMEPALLAGCVGLDEAEVVTGTHLPILASVGNSFLIAEVTAAALGRAKPDLARFAAAQAEFPHLGPQRLPIYLYAKAGRGKLRARMFSPLSGTIEDAATGSAATPLVAMLLALGTRKTLSVEITQGVEMGRPSLLRASAFRARDGVRAKVAGSCVPVFEGVFRA